MINIKELHHCYILWMYLITPGFNNFTDFVIEQITIKEIKDIIQKEVEYE